MNRPWPGRVRRRAGQAGLIFVAVTLAVLSVAFATQSVAAASVSPIQPGNQPTPVAGAANGLLPGADLVNVAPGCQAYRAAGPSIGLLLTEARDRDVALGTEQCYRSLQGQLSEQQVWTAAGNSACAAPVLSSPSGHPVGTSMHGWGKAADFSDVRGTVSFGSPGYNFLKAYAGQVGWNHPGWAEPGGSACPEAWHWEWVGDGGAMRASAIRADVVGLLASGDGRGYATVSGLGGLVTRGDFVNRGSAGSVAIAWLMVGASPVAGGGGYWMVGSDGGVFSFGDARFFGSTGNVRLRQPVVGMAATPDGKGYWLVAADGGVFSFGDARFFGSTGNVRLRQPVVGMAATPDGKGYWLVAADGGVFSFGDARFFGSTGNVRLRQPVVGMAATPDGKGYWLVAADGGVFSFGDARFHGSTGSAPPALPVVSIVATASGDGYWLTAADGEVRAFGGAANLGSA